MAAITVTANTNFDASANLVLNNGETITINNGAVLTVNSDNKWGANNAIFGNITINDGTLYVDGTTVRILNFTGATSLPVTGDTCSGLTSGAYGEVIRVSGTTTNGQVKIRSVCTGSTSGLTYGAFINNETLNFTGGKSAIANGTDNVGWLMMVGVEGSTITTTRQANVIISGSWYTIGTSNGTANQAFRYYLPDALPAVWVERTSGSGIYDIWLNAGNRWGSIPNNDRGKFFIMSANTAGTITFGDGTRGYIPPSGSVIRVPNIFLGNTTLAIWTGASTSEQRLINATLATRYDFTTTSSGVIDINGAIGAWYPSFGQAYSVNLNNFAVFDQIAVSEIAGSCVLDNVGVGITGGSTNQPLTITTNQNTIVRNSNFAQRDATTTGAINVTTSNNTLISSTTINTFNRIATTDCLQLNTSSGITLDSIFTNGGRIHLVTCDGVNMYNITHSDMSTGTTNNVNLGITAIACDTGSKNIMISGVTFSGSLGTLLAPRNSIAQFSNCTNIKIRNIGSPTNLLACQNQIGYIVELTQNNNNIDISRCYVVSARTGTFLTTNSNNKLLMQDVWSSLNNRNIAGNQYNQQTLNAIGRNLRIGNGAIGLSTSGVSTAQTAVFGTHFYTIYTSDTVGYIGYHMTEKTTDSYSVSAYTIVSGSPAFNAGGSLLMRTYGDEIEYSHPFYIYGFSGFTNTPLKFNGVNQNFFQFRYKIDNGSGTFSDGYSAITSISGESISAQTGFKLKLNIKTLTANTNNRINGISIQGDTSLSLQQSIQYPLDEVSVRLTLTNIKSGSEVRIFRSSDNVELAGVESSNTTFTYDYLWSQDVDVDIVILNLGYVYYRINNYTLTNTNVSLPIDQQIDRNYLNL